MRLDGTGMQENVDNSFPAVDCTHTDQKISQCLHYASVM